MLNLLILGAGGHGKVVADVATQTRKWDKISFLDDNLELYKVNGIEVIGKLSDYFLHTQKYQHAFVAIGDGKVRLKWIEILNEAGFNIPSLIHPFSSVSKYSQISFGTLVNAGVVVNTNVEIGTGCILNTNCSVDHDSILQDGVHLSPGVKVSGSVLVGRRSWICVGSTISNNIEIGSDVIVAAGAVVINSIPDNVMVAGVPAIIKKKLGVE